MRHAMLSLVSAVSLGIFPAAADAAVRYDFEAFSSFPNNGESITSGAFSVTLPDFVAGTTVIPVASLTSCSGTTNLQVGTCRDQEFWRTATADYIGFDLATGANPNTQIYYYFAAGAFGAVGVYDTVQFGANQAGRLTVRVVDGAVPEPATWAMLILGFGLVGSALRRRSARAQGARSKVRFEF